VNSDSTKVLVNLLNLKLHLYNFTKGTPCAVSRTFTICFFFFFTSRRKELWDIPLNTYNWICRNVSIITTCLVLTTEIDVRLFQAKNCVRCWKLLSRYSHVNMKIRLAHKRNNQTFRGDNERDLLEVTYILSRFFFR